MKSRAFTLIELLVVVLIIGILSAIALPQYRISVAKTKFANLQTVARTYARAAEVVKLESGSWPNSFDTLSVDVTGGSSFNTTYNGNCATNDQMYCCLIESEPGMTYDAIICGLPDYSLAYSFEPGTRQTCWVNPADHLDAVCTSLGGINSNSAGNVLLIPGGTKSSYNRYDF